MDVHLCPAVPTAPKTIAVIAVFRSASGVTIIALFPPSSSIILPNLFETTCAACLPTLVEPVIDNNGILLSFNIFSPIVDPLPITRLKIPSGNLFSFNTSSIIFCIAIAESGTLEDGFHRFTSPQTAASIAFHAQTATGKLKEEIVDTIPNG